MKQIQSDNIEDDTEDFFDVEEVIDNLSADSSNLYHKLMDYSQCEDCIVEIVTAYLIYDFKTLFELNQSHDGNLYDIIASLNPVEIMYLVDLFIELDKEISKPIDITIFENAIKKFKRDNAKLRKKLEQPQYLITTAQFTQRYSFSAIQQKEMRRNMIDPIPYIKIEDLSKEPYNITSKTIRYNTKDVELWLENYVRNAKSTLKLRGMS